MIDQATLITYLLILLGFVFIPGPAILLTLAQATRSGTSAGLATGCGIAIGDVLHTLLAVVGISTVILASAILFNVVKCIGAAYLVYLGIRAITDKPLPEHFAQSCHEYDAQQTQSGNSRCWVTNSVKPTMPLGTFKLFREAILLEVLNPKSAMFFLAFLPQFVDPSNGSVAIQLFTLGILFVLMGLFSTVVVAICAGQVGQFIKNNPLMMSWQNKIVGGIYCGLGLRLAFQER